MYKTTAPSKVAKLANRRSVRVTAIVGLSALALVAAVPAAAQAVGTHKATTTATQVSSGSTFEGPKPTVVLVHGAFADASGWNGVVDRLTEAGYPVRALADPLQGLASDSAYVHSFLSTIPGPIILVGHSYGGAVITNAAVGEPQVKALVYIAALVPDSGESLSALQAIPVKDPDAPLPLVTTPYTRADGSTGYDLSLDPTKFRATFAADVPAKLAAEMAIEQRPVDASAFAGVTPVASWHTIPSWFLVARQDKTLSPNLELFEAARAHSHITEINSSHVAMISQPKAVTTLIEQAAFATK
jgi:pimeloyl-ACP methyl ester carboxylesterase